MSAHRDVAAVGVVGVVAGATMFLALFPQIFAERRGIDGTFAAWWVVTLVVFLPFLHAAPGRFGHGMRALGLAAVAPVLAFTTLLAIGRPLTGSWFYLCGTAMIGIMALPLVAAGVGAGGVSLVWGGVRTIGRRWVAVVAAVPVFAVASIVAFGWVSEDPAPRAETMLATEVRTLAPLPAVELLGEVPIVVAGTRVARRCVAQDCELEVDGLRAETLTDRNGPLELAEGLGYRFVRPIGSNDPSVWLAYRPGAAYGTQLDRRSLGCAVVGPAGLGAGFVVTWLVALAYLAAALVRLAGLARLGAAVPALVVGVGAVQVGALVAACDPSVALGPAVLFGRVDDRATYRAHAIVRGRLVSGEQRALRDAAWDAIAEDVAMAAGVLAIGVTPMVVVMNAGLGMGW